MDLEENICNPISIECRLPQIQFYLFIFFLSKLNCRCFFFSAAPWRADEGSVCSPTASLIDRISFAFSMNNLMNL